MKDEIKEILDNPKILMLSYGNYISLDDYVKLKDYITNLQQNYERIYNENCLLREKHNITDISLLDENYNLQQENERLRKELENISLDEANIRADILLEQEGSK